MKKKDVLRLGWLILAVGIIIYSLAYSPRVYAATTAPAYAHAWYITNPNTGANGAMYNLGFSDGTRDNTNCIDALVILDFGQVGYQTGGSYGGYGTYYYASTYPFISDATILLAAEKYVTGWYSSTGTCPKLHIAFGLNNYNQCPSGGACTPNSAGKQWADLVNNMKSWLASQGYSWQVTAWAANDMEQPGGGQSWDCATKTRAFVDGFNSNNSAVARLIDFGTAWVPVTGCWSNSDVYYVAWQTAAGWPQPEIYFSSALNSWINLGYSMSYQGEMTTCNQEDSITGTYCTSPSTYWTPGYAWQQLWNVVGQSTLPYSTNIRSQQ